MTSLELVNLELKAENRRNRKDRNKIIRKQRQKTESLTYKMMKFGDSDAFGTMAKEYTKFIGYNKTIVVKRPISPSFLVIDYVKL